MNQVTRQRTTIYIICMGTTPNSLPLPIYEKTLSVMSMVLLSV